VLDGPRELCQDGSATLEWLDRGERIAAGAVSGARADLGAVRRRFDVVFSVGIVAVPVPENGCVLVIGNAHTIVLNGSNKGQGYRGPLEHSKGVTYRELLHAYRPANQDDVANVLFEFVAPRSTQEVARLFETISALQGLRPTFVCVTCRADSRDENVELVGRIRRETGLEVMAHLVCNGATRDQIDDILNRLDQYEVVNVLALRGDIDDPALYRESVHDGLAHGSDLIRFIARRSHFCIGGACYPEAHIDSKSRVDDIAYMKRKVEAGASFLITQLFFDNQLYVRHVNEARAAGITVPILPGILPITNVHQLAAARVMGASVPQPLECEVMARADDPQAIAQFGVAWATLQCTNLLAGGAPGIHFYTVNRPTRAVLGALVR